MSDDSEVQQLRGQVTALRQELAGKEIVYTRLHDYVEKLLKQYSELEDENEFLKTRGNNGSI